MEEIQRMGFTATLSMPATGLDYLWNVLSENLPANHWRAAMCGNFIASVHCREEDNRKTTYKRILGTGYQAEVAVSSDFHTHREFMSQATVPKYSREVLENMKLPELKEVCQKYNIPKKGSIFSLILNSKELRRLTLLKAFYFVWKVNMLTKQNLTG
jgi:hypothetical protein